MTKNCHNYVKKIPDGDSHERDVCTLCGDINYENPKIVNVSVAVHKGKILLCRRAIQPKGFWTLPGGYMENGETVKQGALREAFEEAGAGLKMGPLIGIYHTPSLKTVIMVFRAEVASPALNPGPESMEAKFFDWKDIPWKELAFPMDHAALKQYERTKHLTSFPPEIATLAPTPNDPHGVVKKKPRNNSPYI